MKTKRWLAIGCAVAVLLTAAIAMGCLRLPFEQAAAVDAADYGLVLADRNGEVYVLAVEENSSASCAGVEPGDVVASLDGNPTDSVSAFQRVEKSISSSPVMVVHRRGEPVSVCLKNP